MSARHCPPRGRAPASSALVALAAFLASATLQACRSMAPPHAPAHPFDDAALLAALSAEPRLEPFLANADLLERFRRGAPLNQPNFELFYTPGPEGYTDYPTLD